jgi:hypothetical protein
VGTPGDGEVAEESEGLLRGKVVDHSAIQRDLKVTQQGHTESLCHRRLPAARRGCREAARRDRAARDGSSVDPAVKEHDNHQPLRGSVAKL